MKTHLNLGTRDLEKSVSFYRTLLDAEPAKKYEDYALFLTDQPALELALDADPSAKASESAHYGVVVDSVHDVDAAIARLQAAHVAIDVEREETCCYAAQTKVWAADPDGRRWEIYTVLEDTERRDDCCKRSGTDSLRLAALAQGPSTTRIKDALLRMTTLLASKDALLRMTTLRASKVRCSG